MALHDLGFILEVYDEEGEDRNMLISFESNTPFVSVNKGDILDPTAWQMTGIGGDKFRVERVEHLIGQHQGRGLAFQQVRVFTKRVGHKG
jgi:hypothetical protein